MSDSKLSYSLKYEANELMAKYGVKAISKFLDTRMIKTAFFVVECSMKLGDKFPDHVCSRKFNLMCLDYAYAPLRSNKKLPEMTESQEMYYIRELEKWPDWHGYDLKKMLRIIHVFNCIAEAIFDYKENGTTFSI